MQQTTPARSRKNGRRTVLVWGIPVLLVFLLVFADSAPWWLAIIAILWMGYLFESGSLARCLGRPRLSGLLRGAAGVVRGRGACVDYLEWLRCRMGSAAAVREPVGVAAEHGRWECSRALAELGDGGDDVRSHPDAAADVVCRGVDDDQPEARVSALGVQRALGLGSYQTAWAMLHRYRSAMVARARASGGG